MHTKFINFLTESSNTIEINFNGEVSTNSLMRDFVELSLDEDDIKIFCRSNTTVSYFEVKIPYSFDMDIEMLLSEYVERGINGIDMDHDKHPDVSAYWFDFGNGLQSIAVGYEFKSMLNRTNSYRFKNVTASLYSDKNTYIIGTIDATQWMENIKNKTLIVKIYDSEPLEIEEKLKYLSTESKYNI